MNGNEIKHESFGSIGAYHVSGDAKLFMSPHRHQHFIEVRISSASVDRSLSNDWFHGHREQFISVRMSEAQWAHFVSSPNMGSGSPCTIVRYRDGDLKNAADPPDSAANRATFSKELAEHAAQILEGVNDALRDMERMLKSGRPVTKAELSAVASKLSRAKSNSVDGGMGFVLQQGEEWLDKMVESAKTEIEAHAMAGLKGIALAAIASEIDLEAKTRLLQQIKQAASDPTEEQGRRADSPEHANNPQPRGKG